MALELTEEDLHICEEFLLTGELGRRIVLKHAKMRQENKIFSARIVGLEVALRNLLDDTQHSTHNCDDPECPVDLARKALVWKA